MAKTYTASVTIDYWKQHTCVECGSKFRYRMQRALQAQGPSAEVAQEALVGVIVKTQAAAVDVHPCPQCGMVQPEMVATSRSGILLAGVWIAIIGLIATGIFGVWSMPTSIWAGTVVAVIAAIPLLIGMRRNPNAAPDANRSMAEGHVAQGVLHLHERGSDSNSGFDAFPTGLGVAAMYGALLLFLAVAVVPMPEILRMINGWPMNADWRPPVVGPGDESTCTFDSTIRSIKGMWHGAAAAEVLNANALEIEVGQFPGRTKDSRWGNTITGKSVSSSTNSMWATIMFPDDERLANKSVELELVTNVQFPVEMAGGFDNAGREFRHASTVRMATAGAGAAYHKYWLGGHIAAGLLFVLAWFTLRSANKSVASRGLPTEIVDAPDT